MNVDRKSRVLSVAVALFAVALGLYLAWNPRGLPRHDGRFSNRSDTTKAESVPFDAAEVVGGTAGRSGEKVQTTPDRFQQHYAQLIGSDLDVSRDEMATVAGDTVYDAIASLRPYWLNEELHAVVRVGGQLVGDVAALRNIGLSSVDELRLEFSPTEPHWIIQIFMEP